MKRFVTGAAFGAGFVIGWFALGQQLLEQAWKRKCRNTFWVPRGR